MNASRSTRFESLKRFAANSLRGKAVPLALGLILLFGAFLRLTGVNWDEGQHLHPDERFLTFVENGIDVPKSIGEYFDTAKSSLNPYNRNFGTFVYGTYPIILTKFIAVALNPFGKFITGTFYRAKPNPVSGVYPTLYGILVDSNGYDGVTLLGRTLSALFDLFTVYIIFLIGRRLAGTRVGLLAALFLAASVLDIQQSHFFTVDTFANVPLVLAFWYTLDIAEGKGGWRSWALTGAFFGLSIAARINLLAFGGVIAFAVALRLVRSLEGLRISIHRANELEPAPERTYAFAAGSIAEPDEGMLLASALPATTTRVFNLGPLALELQATRKVRAVTQEQVVSGGTTNWFDLLLNVAVGAGIAILFAFIVFRIAQPYAFKGLIGLNPKFLDDMKYASQNVAGEIDSPPGHQWTGRTDYVFPWLNIVQWGLGPALGLASWLGVALAGWQMIRKRDWTFALAFFWVGGLFLYEGQQFGKTMRYYLPLYPFLALFAAYFLNWLWDAAGRWRRASGWGAWLPRFAAGAAIVVTIGYTLFWAGAFTSIYTRPVSRAAASRWIFANIPAGTALGEEHWDDGLPLRLDGKDGGIYKGVELAMYDEDAPEKRDRMIGWMDQVDYVFETSNRLYLSIPRLPLRYPLTTKYYEWLFDGKLGFQLVQTFTSYPQLFGITINDDNAEEAFTVYDHPKVLIFKKTAAYSHDNTTSLFNSVDLSEVVRQKPLDYDESHNAFQLTPSDLAADRAGGTWSQIFNPDDFVNKFPVASWFVLLEILGLIGFPLTFVAFRRFADRGYAFAKAFAILALAWGAWTLASYHALPFTRATIFIVLLALVAASAVIGFFQRRELIRFVRTNLKLLAVEESVFIAFFVIDLLIRFGNPDLWHPSFGGEKPMDFTYLNGIIKTTWFPAYNPWFEGSYINYYYFGQVISATLVKFIGIVPEVAYNLLLPMFFGLTAVGAFGVGFNLVNAVLRRDRATEDARETSELLWRAIGAGIIASVFVLIIGNVGEVGVLASGLMKLGQPLKTGIPGVGGLYTLLTGGLAWLLKRQVIPIGTGDWYWTATRVIPDTINEFPFFTFLYADLHAHLMALPYTLVALGLAVHAVIRRARLQWYELGVAALILGALRAINTWDYPTYLAIIAAAMVIGYFAEKISDGGTQLPVWIEHLPQYLVVVVIAFVQISLLVVSFNAVGVKVTTDVATYILILALGVFLGWIVVGSGFDPRGLVTFIGWRFIALVALSILFYWPFVSEYGTAYTSVELWKDKRTSLQEYLVVHGIFLFVIATYLVIDNFRRRAARVESASEGQGAEAPSSTLGFFTRYLIYFLPAFVFIETVLILFDFRVFAVIFPLVLLGLWALLRRDTTPERRLIGLLMVAGMLMTLMVEVVTLKGDIGRMNTVFKFYLQAWVMFAVTGAAGLVLIFDKLRTERAPVAVREEGSAEGIETATRPSWTVPLKQVWWGVFAVLIACGLLYPVFATWAKVNDRYVPNSPAGLNGMDYMRVATYNEGGHEVHLTEDQQAIEWLRANVQGSPVIAEANTGLYRWGDRISINTGLPTIIGWDWHTKQQYSLLSGEIIDHRLEDLKTLYNTPDPAQAMTLLRRYNVSFVYVGGLERAVYEANGLSKFEAMADGGALRKVYDSDNVQIYQLNPQANALAP